MLPRIGTTQNNTNLASSAHASVCDSARIDPIGRRLRRQNQQSECQSSTIENESPRASGNDWTHISVGTIDLSLHFRAQCSAGGRFQCEPTESELFTHSNGDNSLSFQHTLVRHASENVAPHRYYTEQHESRLFRACQCVRQCSNRSHRSTLATTESAE